MSGTTVRSIPTMPPTKAFTSTKRANCRQFSLKPSLTFGSAASVAALIKVRPQCPCAQHWIARMRAAFAVAEEYLTDAPGYFRKF